MSIYKSFEKTNMPLVSIITAVYNGKDFLEKTILSIINQSYTNIEYIIIDGGSRDGTLDIIEKYQNKITYWISEPDNGLYDAMNKGINKTNGNYLLFLNAGDEFYSLNTLHEIFTHHINDADVYYGETMLIDNFRNDIGLLSDLTHNNTPDDLNWKKMNKGMVVCHQSFIVRKQIAPLYNLRFKYCSDIDWVIECLKRSKKIIHTHLIISKYLTGGYSKINIYYSWLDRFFVLIKHFGVLPTLFNHLLISKRAIKIFK